MSVFERYMLFLPCQRSEIPNAFRDEAVLPINDNLHISLEIF